jgi:hypothetical protein
VRNSLYYVAALLVFCTLRAQAQQSRSFASQRHAWLAVNTEPRFSQKWGARGELILRRAEAGQAWQQIQFRLAPVWNPRTDLQLSVGYLFSRTFPYGKFPVRRVFNENRLYQQLVLRSALGHFAVAHRFRLEQRWSKPVSTIDPTERVSVFTNRARYQARAVLPFAVSSKKLGPYGAVSSEIFISFGKQVARNIFEQFRAYGGFGWQFSKATAVELGYMHQLVQQSNGVNFERNHTLQLTVNFNPNFAGQDAPRPETNDNGD